MINKRAMKFVFGFLGIICLAMIVLVAASYFDQKDIDEVQRASRNYGMQHGKNRSMFFNNENGWKSLHINMKDLGLDEVLKTCSAAIATSFNVPKDLIPVFDNSTFTNKKEASIELIQNVIEPIAADFAKTWTSSFPYQNKKVCYSVDHLAPMQYIEDLKTDKAVKLSAAYRNFTQAGMTPEQTNELFESLGINLMDNEE